MIFMTTNHIEKLDPALIRPGRCDVKIEFKNASKLQIEKLYSRFYPKDEEYKKDLLSMIPGNFLSMSQLQGYFLIHKDNPKDCLLNFSKFLNENSKG
jgi:mitochondrial chaperone BCS1